MLSPIKFFESLTHRGISRFFVVPDSLLADFCAVVNEFSPPGHHVIAANEGNAVALAIGHYLASREPAVVYLQNSGLGNIINPLTSLVDQQVYQIPIIFVIGWRGEPGRVDEPQHIKQGAITEDQLSILGVRYWIIDSECNYDLILDELFNFLNDNSSPVALLVKTGTFDEFRNRKIYAVDDGLVREKALEVILSAIGPRSLIISTTGKASRELFEVRRRRGETPRDFLTVGGMGHASSIALGIALSRPLQRIICLDGDGAAIMHLGSMAVIGQLQPRNFVHVVLNNRSHESVGGQPTAACSMDFQLLAKSLGYTKTMAVSDEKSLALAFNNLDFTGPIFIEVKILQGSRKNLGRPSSSPKENRDEFVSYLETL